MSSMSKLYRIAWHVGYRYEAVANSEVVENLRIARAVAETGFQAGRARHEAEWIARDDPDPGLEA